MSSKTERGSKKKKLPKMAPPPKLKSKSKSRRYVSKRTRAGTGATAPGSDLSTVVSSHRKAMAAASRDRSVTVDAEGLKRRALMKKSKSARIAPKIESFMVAPKLDVSRTPSPSAPSSPKHRHSGRHVPATIISVSSTSDVHVDDDSDYMVEAPRMKSVGSTSTELTTSARASLRAPHGSIRTRQVRAGTHDAVSPRSRFNLEQMRRKSGFDPRSDAAAYRRRTQTASGRSKSPQPPVSHGWDSPIAKKRLPPIDAMSQDPSGFKPHSSKRRAVRRIGGSDEDDSGGRKHGLRLQMSAVGVGVEALKSSATVRLPRERSATGKYKSGSMTPSAARSVSFKDSRLQQFGALLSPTSGKTGVKTGLAASRRPSLFDKFVKMISKPTVTGISGVGVGGSGAATKDGFVPIKLKVPSPTKAKKASDSVVIDDMKMSPKSAKRETKKKDAAEEMSLADFLSTLGDSDAEEVKDPFERPTLSTKLQAHVGAMSLDTGSPLPDVGTFKPLIPISSSVGVDSMTMPRTATDPLLFGVGPEEDLDSAFDGVDIGQEAGEGFSHFEIHVANCHESCVPSIESVHFEIRVVATEYSSEKKIAWVVYRKFRNFVEFDKFLKVSVKDDAILRKRIPALPTSSAGTGLSALIAITGTSSHSAAHSYAEVKTKCNELNSYLKGLCKDDYFKRHRYLLLFLGVTDLDPYRDSVWVQMFTMPDALPQSPLQLWTRGGNDLVFDESFKLQLRFSLSDMVSIYRLDRAYADYKCCFVRVFRMSAAGTRRYHIMSSDKVMLPLGHSHVRSKPLRTRPRGISAGILPKASTSGVGYNLDARKAELCDEFISDSAFTVLFYRVLLTDFIADRRCQIEVELCLSDSLRNKSKSAGTGTSALSEMVVGHTWFHLMHVLCSGNTAFESKKIIPMSKTIGGAIGTDPSLLPSINLSVRRFDDVHSELPNIHHIPKATFPLPHLHSKQWLGPKSTAAGISSSARILTTATSTSGSAPDDERKLRALINNLDNSSNIRSDLSKLNRFFLVNHKFVEFIKYKDKSERDVIGTLLLDVCKRLIDILDITGKRADAESSSSPKKASTASSQKVRDLAAPLLASIVLMYQWDLGNVELWTYVDSSDSYSPMCSTTWNQNMKRYHEYMVLALSYALKVVSQKCKSHTVEMDGLSPRFPKRRIQTLDCSRLTAAELKFCLQMVALAAMRVPLAHKKVMAKLCMAKDRIVQAAKSVRYTSVASAMAAAESAPGIGRYMRRMTASDGVEHFTWQEPYELEVFERLLADDPSTLHSLEFYFGKANTNVFPRAWDYFMKPRSERRLSDMFLDTPVFGLWLEEHCDDLIYQMLWTCGRHTHGMTTCWTLVPGFPRLCKALIQQLIWTQLGDSDGSVVQYPSEGRSAFFGADASTQQPTGGSMAAIELVTRLMSIRGMKSALGTFCDALLCNTDAMSSRKVQLAFDTIAHWINACGINRNTVEGEFGDGVIARRESSMFSMGLSAASGTPLSAPRLARFTLGGASVPGGLRLDACELLPSMWCYDNFVEACRRILQQRDFQVTALLLSFVLKHAHLFPDALRLSVIRDLLVAECFVPLFCHWNQLLRKFYHRVLLFCSNRVGYFNEERRQKALGALDEVTQGFSGLKRMASAESKTDGSELDVNVLSQTAAHLTVTNRAQMEVAITRGHRMNVVFEHIVRLTQPKMRSKRDVLAMARAKPPADVCAAIGHSTKCDHSDATDVHKLRCVFVDMTVPRRLQTDNEILDRLSLEISKLKKLARAKSLDKLYQPYVDTSMNEFHKMCGLYKKSQLTKTDWMFGEVVLPTVQFSFQKAKKPSDAGPSAFFQ